MSQEGLKYIRIGICNAVKGRRLMIKRRFQKWPIEMAYRVSYWRVDDIEFAHPSVALAIIDRHVRKLIP